ncbi:DNA mismatch repair protein MutT [Sinorhizobium mexicanum]|uniref:DNA mismatch repair protein MutT n=1 Tax=Sinorhizobium mexicanum TaxID=375549 RepID=UPI001D71255E|nr:DNA mismatch repair protein MutT [Sinorhizobium mexicanum]MBP1881890.1 hypothetical protein [Sinorhizobium mexicanum]
MRIRNRPLSEGLSKRRIIGSADASPLGSFYYFKDSSTRRYRVTVHVLEMQTLAKSFPEKAVRKTRWFSLDEAARAASQLGLRTLLLKLR